MPGLTEYGTPYSAYILYIQKNRVLELALRSLGTILRTALLSIIHTGGV